MNIRLDNLTILFVADLSSDSDQNEDGGHEEFNEASIMGLIDVVCILLNENKSKFKMPQNLVLWENIKSRFNKTCSLFFRYFRVIYNI